jgi:hypothetical protein
MANAHDPKPWLPIAIFFPEIIYVAASVLLAPVWCVRLVGQGHVLYACLVLSVAIAGALGFVWSMLRRRRFVAWVIMLATFFALLFLYGSLAPSERFLGGLGRLPSGCSWCAAKARYEAVGVLFSGGTNLVSKLPPNNGVQRTVNAPRSESLSPSRRLRVARR